MSSANNSLTFGTGGIRAIMGDNPDQINPQAIQKASLALARYLKTAASPPFSVAISYDTRNRSQEFAGIAATTLIQEEIDVYLTKHPRPTPFVSFLCREKKCSAAIMITASHNPKEYNGFKVYWEGGGQVVPPHDKGIIDEFNAIKELLELPTSKVEPNIDDELDAVFIEATKTTACLATQNKKFGARLNVYYTSLHGAGISLIEKAFKAWGFSHYRTIDKQCIPDGNFSTVTSPNPEDTEALSMGIQKLLAEDGDLLLANDPDADRVAAVVRKKNKAHILSGNEIAAILLHHIEKNKKLPKNATVISTIVTTPLLDKICAAKKIKIIKVLTGFKYIAEKIEPGSFIFAAEQSYGYLAGDYVRDKDGIGIAMLLSEAALDAKLNGKTLLDHYHELEETYGIHRSKERSIQTTDPITKNLRENPPLAIANLKVTSIDDNKSGDVLTYHLEGCHQLIVRPSGTEPKVKIYAMTCGKDAEKLLDPLLNGII